MPQPHPRPEWLESAGKKDGRYVLGPILGHGGMGDVREAWDTLLGRLVALKILTHVEPAAMVRFMHEAQLQARLEHPNICRIYDVDVAGGVPRIAMQLVRGPTLEDASKDLELTEVVTIIARVAETLRDAHRGGLIHRDVKPGNIILEWMENGGWNPILCDFGLALALNESSLTQPNALTGTPAYMAPEQVRGDRKLVGPATDVYGLGGTLYFLLLGRPPCISTVTKEMLRVKREKRFPMPRALEPCIPPELEGILLRCLAPDPADRYPSMAELAQELWNFLGQTPVAAPTGRRFPKPWLAASAVLGLGLGLGGLAWGHGAGRAHWVEQVNRAAQEAENLEEGLRAERSLPVHDIRPALARIREDKDAFPRLLGIGEGGPLELVRGTADFCLGDYPAARASLEKAWEEGMTAPRNAYLLGIACAEEWMLQSQESAYRGTPAPGAFQDRAADWFRRAKGLSRDREEYAQALLAFMKQDLPGALDHARKARAANPWRVEATTLGSLCLSRLARDCQAQGKLPEAREHFREALEWAETDLPRAPSDGNLHHAGISARLGLGELDRLAGDLSAPALEELAQRAQRALSLDPDAPLAQGDWLSLQCLKAMRQADLHLDPKDTLEGAMAFYWSRTREPRPPGLRGSHMILYWLMAKREAARGATSAPALAEALKEAGHALDTTGDVLGDILTFKAEKETRSPRQTRRLPAYRAAMPAA